MKNSETEELPKLSIERNPLFLLLLVALSGLLILTNYFLFKAMNPWGFLMLIPASFIPFQTLWMLLRPFAQVYADRVEIKNSLFSNKLLHFIDIKKISSDKKGKLYVTYKDDEVERLNLYGIRKAHQNLLKTEIEKKISA